MVKIKKPKSKNFKQENIIGISGEDTFSNQTYLNMQ